MAFDIRKILVIFAVAALFGFFSYALFDAFYPQVEWSDYCIDKPYVEVNNSASCEAAGGRWETNNYAPIEKGGVSGWCNMYYYCQQAFDDVNKDRNFYAFLVMSILGGIAILVGIYLPSANPINEWIGTGLMLGGLFDLFFGTSIYYRDLDRYIRPIILFIELALVILLTYKKLGPKAQSKGKKMPFSYRKK